MANINVNALFQNSANGMDYVKQVDDAEGIVITNQTPKDEPIPTPAAIVSNVPHPQIHFDPTPVSISEPVKIEPVIETPHPIIEVETPIIIEPIPQISTEEIPVLEVPEVPQISAEETLIESTPETPQTLAPIIAAPIVIEGAHNRTSNNKASSSFPRKKSDQEVTPEFLKEFVDGIVSMNYGDYLRGLMKIAGVSQKDLAAYCKVNFMYISDFVTMKKKLKKEVINNIIKFMNESERLRAHPEVFKAVCGSIVNKFKEGVREVSAEVKSK